MHYTRRTFLRSLLAGAAVLSVAERDFARKLLSAGDSDSSDSLLLDELQRASFDFFWNEADTRTGLVRDRADANGNDKRRLSSIAATGFGLTALCIGHHRKYEAESEIVDRVRTSLKFLAEEAPHVHGFFYHYVDMNSGQRIASSEVSPIDMAIFLCGVLTCREYFHDKEIRKNATRIYERVEWPWALDGADTFSLEWTPEFGFSPLRWDSYSECPMMYLLAIGSPTFPVPATSWRAIKRPWLVYEDYRFISSPAPIFVHQFPQAWFDFRHKRDQYADYYQNSVLAVKAHRQFCMDLKDKFSSYSEKCWGITASDSCNGYVAWGGPPLQGPVDGTIVPAAAAGSLPFLFSDSVTVLRHLREQYGERIWKKYGFVDAFNPLNNWIDRDVVGIDVGISMLMAENARTRFVWDVFMRNREARVAMEKCGFHSHFRMWGMNTARS
jgi:hypothetical protein